mgnify:CR=1 FL=1
MGVPGDHRALCLHHYYHHPHRPDLHPKEKRREKQSIIVPRAADVIRCVWHCLHCPLVFYRVEARSRSRHHLHCPSGLVESPANHSDTVSVSHVVYPSYEYLMPIRKKRRLRKKKVAGHKVLPPHRIDNWQTAVPQYHYGGKLSANSGFPPSNNIPSYFYRNGRGDRKGTG